MTNTIVINDEDPTISYTATAFQRNFDVPWPFFTEDSLEVYLTVSGATADDTNDLLVRGSAEDYIVEGAGNDGSASPRRIALTSSAYPLGASAGDTVVIRRAEPIQRTSDLAAQGDFSSTTFNDEQDVTFMILQQFREELNRALKRAVTSTDITAASSRITDLADPTADQDAATKGYMDAALAAAIFDDVLAGAAALISRSGPALNLFNNGEQDASGNLVAVARTQPSSGGGLAVIIGGSSKRVLNVDDLVTVTTGEWSPTWVGFAGGSEPTNPIFWRKEEFTDSSGNATAVVHMWQESFITGTSNATNFQATGLPAEITPTATQEIKTHVRDDSLDYSGAIQISSSNLMAFGITEVSGSRLVNNYAAFTNTGNKGLRRFAVSYVIN